MPSYNPLDYGVVGFVLILVWKAIDVAKTVILSKKVGPVPCQVDPLYFKRIVKMQDSIEVVRQQFAAGPPQCNWRDRDEVRDFMEAIRAQTSASKTQTSAINELTQEMRLTRSSNHG